LGALSAQFPPATKAVLASTIFFKGKWQHSFQPAKPDVFYITPERTQTAHFMRIKRRYNFGRIDEIATYVSIPYRSEDAMIVLLPNEGITLDDAIDQLTHEQIYTMIDNVCKDRKIANVNLTMPRFEIDSTSSLVEPLKNVCSDSYPTTRLTNPFLLRWASRLCSQAVPT